VAWLTKRVKIGGQWFARKPIITTSGFVTEKVVHDGHSLPAPGSFVLDRVTPNCSARLVSRNDQ
jgi:hypothetical protein